jgi:hypothetical protein
MVSGLFVREYSQHQGRSPRNDSRFPVDSHHHDAGCARNNLIITCYGLSSFQTLSRGGVVRGGQTRSKFTLMRAGMIAVVLLAVCLFVFAMLLNSGGNQGRN